MSESSRNNSPRAGAAQTASIGDQDMMTFLFNDGPNASGVLPPTVGVAAEHAAVAARGPQENSSAQYVNHPNVTTTPAGVPDPLMRFLSRGESLMTDEDAFDAASLDALLNYVRTSPHDQGGDMSDFTATDALSSLGELSRAHAQATEANEQGDVRHHNYNGAGKSPEEIPVLQSQGAQNYAGNMANLQGNNSFQPSQPISVSTGAVFSVAPMLGYANSSIDNGGGLMMGFNESMAQQQRPTQHVPLPYTMMPDQQQQQALPSGTFLSNPLLPYQPSQNSAITFQAPSFAQNQQPQQMSSRAPWGAAASAKLKSPNPPAPAAGSSKSNKRKKTTATSSTTSSSYPPISEDESDRKKRRSQRNLREQERSHQITARINELRNLLAEAGVHFKPDRYSTLVGVVNYIKMLQGRTKSLDEEHRKLIDTISGANRLANGGGTTTVQSHNKVLGESATQSSSDSNTDEEFLIFLQGIDYKFIFKSCGVALAITSVDGRFVDCNEEFLRVTEYTRDELLGGGKMTGGVANSSNTSTSGATSPTIGGLVTVYTTTSTNTSEMTTGAAAAAAGSAASHTPDHHPSFPSRPPAEVHMHKKTHLSLFNLLGREDMENVYAAMSRMLKAPNSESRYVSSSSRDASNSSSGKTSGKESSAKSSSKESSGSSSGQGESSSMPRSSSSDSMLGSTTSSSGNEVSGDSISRYTVDHWSGKINHTRRKEQVVSNSELIVRLHNYSMLQS